MNLDRDTINKIRWLVVFTVAVAVAGMNYQKILGILVLLLGMAGPFLTGGAMAFILNVPMRNIERRLPIKRVKWKRPAALVLTILAVLVVLLTVSVVVVPELFRTFQILQKSVPLFFEQVEAELTQLFSDNPSILAWLGTIQFDWSEFGQEMVDFLKNGAGSVLSTTFSAAASIVSGVTSFFIGFVFAVYILLQKEVLARQADKVLRAYLPESLRERIVGIAALTERTFSSFLTGQCLEAVILGTMFFVTLLILRLPYALLIGVLIAFTALVPLFGAFIGCGVGIFLMLMVSPVDALLFTAVFFILQQIEGNLIYPHVVGNSVGLPSIWVLVAVTLGGSAMGIVGMLVFIPLCSVLYALFRESVNARLKRAEREKKAGGEAGKT